MQVHRFDLSKTADYSKMGKKVIDGKIRHFNEDGVNTKMHSKYNEDGLNTKKRGKYNEDELRTQTQGNYNEGMLRTPMSSTTDLRNIDIQAKEETRDSKQMTVTEGENLVFVHGVGVNHSKEKLNKSLNEYYNTIVESKRKRFHLEMSKIERKVNDVLGVVETMDPSLSFQRMRPSCFYEMKGPNEIDIFLVLDEISNLEFTVEEVVNVEGLARVRQKDGPSTGVHQLSPKETSNTRLGPYFVESNFEGPMYLSAKLLGKHFKDLVHQSFEFLSRDWRDSSPECKLNSKVHQLVGQALERTKSFEKYFKTKQVSFQNDVTCVVNLVPSISCRNFWPRNSEWSRNVSGISWPDRALKQELMTQGVHLVAMPTNRDPDEIWKIKFLHAQRFLRSHESTPCKLKCLRIIKVLCENVLGFSAYFLPMHLEIFALHFNEKYSSERDWTQEMLPMRFLEFLVKIHQGLQTRKCMDYFIADRNLFSDIPEELSSHLARIVLHVLKDPLKYIQ